MTARAWPQGLRFVLVGALNTAFSYSVYAGGLWLGLPYAWANLLALALGLVFSFRTQRTLVFGSDGSAWRFVRFVVLWAVIWLINIALIAGLMGLGLNAYAAGAVALAPVVLLSYIGQRLWVFAEKAEEPKNIL
jgi:putative flippase GtrA